jgi:putative hydrolase of the HAD superfamily
MPMTSPRHPGPSGGPSRPFQIPDWSRIDTVLLDLDGTLLDLAFDTFFWWHHIPAMYGASRSLQPDEAREQLRPRFKACEGTLNWYCVDYWSRELGLDVPALKRAAGDRIGWLPGAEEFLKRLRRKEKRLVLMTNAHPEALRIKDERTGVTRYFDAVYSSHTFGAPKEDQAFWSAVRNAEPFDPDRSIFIDDSPTVVRAARIAGIRWVYALRCPDTSSGPRIHDENHPTADCVADFNDSLR